MRGITLYKHEKYIELISKVLTNDLHTSWTQKYDWITLYVGSKTAFPKPQIRN